MTRLFRYGAALLILGVLSACGSSNSTPPADRAVALSWNQSRESGVNTAGGGYRIDIAGRNSVYVPWIPGAGTPTSTTLRLPSGTYTVAVVAYAALDAQGGTTGNESAPSQSITVTVP
jgi:hypothetical protein